MNQKTINVKERRKPRDWRGYVHLVLEDPETGGVVYHSRNTITLDARRIMAALLGPHEKVVITRPDNAVLLPTKPKTEERLIPDISHLITHVAWGSGTTDPTRDDYKIETPVANGEGFLSTEVQWPVTITENSIIFQSSIDPGVGPDDQEYSEVLLITPKTSSNSDGHVAVGYRVFARFVFPTLKKFRRLRLSVRWEIFFA